jgi:hypothetical protein
MPKTNISFQRIRKQLRISTRDVETFYFWPKKRSTNAWDPKKKKSNMMAGPDCKVNPSSPMS